MILGCFGRQKTKPNKAKFTLAPSTAVGLKGCLKKQSQYSRCANDVNSFMKGFYGKLTLVGAEENKANRQPLAGNPKLRNITDPI